MKTIEKSNYKEKEIKEPKESEIKELIEKSEPSSIYSIKSKQFKKDLGERIYGREV